MIKKEKAVRGKAIPEYKLKLVSDLAEKMKKSKTVLIASTKGLPSSQFHDIKKKLRSKAEIKVAKKSAILRAIDKTEKGALISLKKEIGADIALFFSDVDAFELSGMLTDNRSPAKAKPGDSAPEDIEINEGPTELLPGPAISELSSVGLKVAVEGGKLAIKKGAVVVKKGEEIKENVASVLGKLNITPMKVGFEPLAAYDASSDKVYIGIKIDKEAALEELRILIGKAFGFAINIDYPNKETVLYFISKAGLEEKAIEKLLEEKAEASAEKPSEESKEEPKKEEKMKAEEKVEEANPEEEKEEEKTEEVKEEIKEESQSDKEEVA